MGPLVNYVNPRNKSTRAAYNIEIPPFRRSLTKFGYFDNRYLLPVRVTTSPLLHRRAEL